MLLKKKRVVSNTKLCNTNVCDSNILWVKILSNFAKFAIVIGNYMHQNNINVFCFKLPKEYQRSYQ